MRPDSFSTTTWSSIRIGCVVAIWMPAMRLVSSGRAASPTTSPATPAEANKLTPYWRTGSKVIRTALSVTTTIKVWSARLRMRTWVMCLRASRLSAVSTAKRWR